jgi:hypothetical protein
VPNIRGRTLEADCAEDLHDPICAFLPLLPLPLNHTTHPRCTSADEVIVIVDQVCFGANDDDGYACCIMRERARAQWKDGALQGTGRRRKGFGGWFSIVLEVGLPYAELWSALCETRKRRTHSVRGVLHE